MTIEKRASGVYRVSKMVDGKRYRVNFDYKPSKREAEDAIRKLIEERANKPNGRLTFAEASVKYVDMKRNVLSPNTVRDYLKMPNRLSAWFTELEIDDITQIDINKQVNELAAKLKPKTVRNYHAFISTILGTFRPSMKIYTTLPQKLKSEPYTPSDDDIRKLLSALEGTDYFIPVFLGSLGLRRGEVMALTLDDLNGDVLHVNKSMAFDENKKPVIKSTKTTESTRYVVIPMKIANMVRKQGYFYKGNISQLTDKMTEVEKKIGLPHFSFHKLRHYYASKMIRITDEKTAMKGGGWKTEYVMKQTYIHSQQEEYERAMREAATKIGNAIL